MARTSQRIDSREPADGAWTARRLALLALTGLALYLCWLMARPFVASLAWATALAVVAWPMHRRFAKQLRSSGLAAAISTTALALAIVVPTAALAPRLVDQTATGIASIRDWLSLGGIERTLERAPWWLQPVWGWVEDNVDGGALAQRAGDVLAGLGTVAVRASLDGMLQLLLTFFLLYYFLRDRDDVLRGLGALLPLSRAESRSVFHTIGDTLYATLLGKVLVSIMQGVLVGLMFAWLGLAAPFFWGAVTAVVALVPVLGPPVVWGPAAILLALDGRWGGAMALAGWGAAVVGLADNLVYPMMVGNRVRMHTVPMLLSMIGGLFVFGLAGFFLGPVALAATLALLRIWNERSGGPAPPPESLADPYDPDVVEGFEDRRAAAAVTLGSERAAGPGTGAARRPATAAPPR
jgi:predicted PurR-regulated permease PerM